MGAGEFLYSDYGQRLINTSRWLRRLYLNVEAIEPRGKFAMPKEARVAFQTAISRQLRERGRRPYRGPVVLRLRFQTTDRNPGHIHTITKNFLDLLGRTGQTVGRPGALLYQDDRQVCGLAVACEHGASTPSISICSRSLGDFRQNLAIALRAADKRMSWRNEDDRGLIGVSPLAAAQRQQLRHNGLGISDLAFFYRAIDLRLSVRDRLLDDLARKWEANFIEAPFRITIGEPPHDVDTSIPYRQQVADVVRAFGEQFSRLLTPLVIPVALEVVVKPPLASKARAIHDLDNLLRRYLIPEVVKTFQPPSHYLWALDRQLGELLGDARSVKRSEKMRQLPKSTAIGLTRMEAWRIPRAPTDDSPGFVSLALVADDFGYDDSISAVDDAVDAWTESLS